MAYSNITHRPTNNHQRTYNIQRSVIDQLTITKNHKQLSNLTITKELNSIKDRSCIISQSLKNLQFTKVSHGPTYNHYRTKQYKKVSHGPTDNQ